MLRRWGLALPPFLAPYRASKAADIALSESLERELLQADAAVCVSVLCPGSVRTAIN
jgi:short-subunit dehydrogenase